MGLRTAGAGFLGTASYARLRAGNAVRTGLLVIVEGGLDLPIPRAAVIGASVRGVQMAGLT